MKKIGSQLIVIPLGAFLYSIGVAVFLDPNGLAPGGLTGVSIVLNRLTSIDTGTLILLLNIPLLIIAWRLYGYGFVLSSLYSLCWISFFTNLLEKFPVATDDLLLASVGGGALMAIGLGIVFRVGSTTGGTDIIVKLIRRRKKHLKTGFLFLLVDLCVLVFSFLVLRDLEKMMYAGISLGVISVVLDLVLYGRDEAKLVFIISEKPEELTEYFLGNLDIGVTQLEGLGGYTRRKKKIIMCVMKKRLAPLVLEAVKELDTNAFMIVSSASEIFGNGYKSYHGGKNL